VLVATDIVARGIDIDDITMVVNYDVPHEAEDYVHRVGRTARANSDGKAVTFVSERDQQKFGSIERFLEYEVRKETMPAEVGEGPKYEPNRRNNGRGNASQRGRNGNSNSGRGSRNSHNGNRRNNRPTDASKANRPKENSQAQASGGNKQGKRRNFRRRNSSGNKPQGNQ
jgi:superfamily II DNA/RNA helicase